jgi:hypothetical protein
MAGCYLGGPPEVTEVEASAVGPAPLRRLTNEEYVNALHDLFPTLSPALPPLPESTIIAGFDNAIEAQQPSDVVIARYETIADLYAAAATSDDATTRALTGCTWSHQRSTSACADGFIARVGRRIFRRPLDEGELARFRARFATWQVASDFRGAVRLTLTAMLQALQFIYRPEPPPIRAATKVVPVEPFAMASRLSFFLWRSTPDDVLLDAAESGALSSEADIRAQAERMLDDDRAKRTYWSFHRQWLALDRVLTDEQKYRTPQIDPSWTAQTAQSAERETELFVENVLASGGTLVDLLLSRRAWVDGEMARIYALPAPANPNAFTPVDLPIDQRAGVLTRAAFLAGTSHRGGTSPPIRGNAVELRLFCELPVSPPPGADLSMPTAPRRRGPETTRQLFEQRTAPSMCQSCHASLNGIGFGFEAYDAAGAHRARENGVAIDASGTIALGSDVDGAFDGAIELSNAIARSVVVHRCATAQWTRFALGRAPVDAEIPLRDAWADAFVASGGDVRQLLLAIVTSPTFRLRKVGE